MGVGIYFEWNARTRMAMTHRLLEELLGTAASDTPVDFGSNVFDLLSQPLSICADVDDHSKLFHSCRSYGMGWSEC